eukprot:6213351-Pleurochrysis_carterae.AAC.2
MSRTKSSQRLATWLCSDCNLDALSHVSRMRSSLPTMRVLCSKFCCCSCFSCSTLRAQKRKCRQVYLRTYAVLNTITLNV